MTAADTPATGATVLTGATEWQIEDAIQREWDLSIDRGISRMTESIEEYFARHLLPMRQHAECLVPPEHMIVRRDDLEALVEYIEAWAEVAKVDQVDLPAAIRRMQASELAIGPELLARVKGGGE